MVHLIHLMHLMHLMHLLVSTDVRSETLLTRERLVLFPKALVVPLLEAIVPFPEAMDGRVSGALHRSRGILLFKDGLSENGVP